MRAREQIFKESIVAGVASKHGNCIRHLAKHCLRNLISLHLLFRCKHAVVDVLYFRRNVRADIVTDILVDSQQPLLKPCKHASKRSRGRFASSQVSLKATRKLLLHLNVLLSRKRPFHRNAGPFTNCL